MSRKPRNTNDCHLDFYYEQFAEPGDDPEITAHCGSNSYEVIRGGPYPEAVKEMRTHGKWLLQAADYLEKKWRIK